MTRRRRLAACAALAFAAAASRPAAAQQPVQTTPRWTVEAVGGGASLHPDDLNAFSQYREAFSSTYFEALSATQPISTTKEGEFPLLSRAWTAGVGASYQLTPRLAVTAGLQYVSESASSDVQRAHDSTVYNADAVRFQTTDRVSYQFSPLLLELRAYTPTAGVRYALWGSRSMSIEGLLRAGAVYGSCRIEETFASETSYYRLRSSVSTQMEGHGWGPAVEGGARFAWRPRSRWGAFAEVSYAYERVANVNGTLDRSTTTRDGDASETERVLTASLSGRWRMQTATTSASGTVFRQDYPSIASDQGSAFALDLSGVRLRAGFALRFGLGR